MSKDCPLQIVIVGWVDEFPLLSQLWLPKKEIPFDGFPVCVMVYSQIGTA
ncbi:MAG: hypothetical protein RL708_2574 [Bacteroidota bacterium]|jgi:hypothetical protein